MTLTFDVKSLEREVIDALAGGRTRSAIELVGDLAAPYREIEQALRRLEAQRAITVAYATDDETFFRRAPRG